MGHGIKRMPIVVYGVGSPIIADVAETCLRLRLPVAAWVRNIEGESFAPPDATVADAADLGRDIVAHPFLVALFTPGHRRSAVDDAKRRGFTESTTVIDPTAVIASTATIAPGGYVNTLANVAAMARIGAHAFINRGASIAHHVDCADF